MVRLDFLTDPALVLERAGARLAADPVVGTVVASVTARLRDDAAAGVVPDPAVPRWWVLVTDDEGEVVGVGMRTATAPPYALFLLPMPGEAALDLARRLVDQGEEAVQANGALPAVQLFAQETARLVGGQVAVAQHTRLFELGRLVLPRPVPGRLRAARSDELDLAAEWFAVFMAEADEQAGRAPGETHEPEPPDPAVVRRRIDAGLVWFWEDEAGQPVHLTAANPPGFGVARVGPVFTPKPHRGRGYAGAAVAGVSALLRDQGARVCLFTDQANPTSNALYERLGYRPVVDMANLVVERVTPG